ncbi:ATP-binding cassette domain-containing protein [Thermophilibacter sp. ET337]|uniref:energy-coupling factor ABC transporter ATP-binding protein n=1 Tax=Thermophilibacter sp. ET337 TaxID=2973084 RepID=UPI0021AC8F4C|nr:ATP-binding cassette domain-containing protein [Thermophilibacter sp. ET337]MCR8907370.1 ATP-binding cassette domain-containing protein [Thermophilibacter sp. ET337]
MRVTLEDICLCYEDAAGERVRALDGVSLELSGGVCGLMGQTGSGKTTLLEVMAGVSAPDAGRVLVDGLDAARGAGARALAASVGLVFQLPERQFFEPTVTEELTFGLLARGMGAEEARERAARALALMGLSMDELGRRSPFALSGGQQRRVAIASVLAARPSLLLLDEPTAGLDPRACDACLAAVRSAAAEGATVVMASHDANALAEVADRVVCLEGGRVTLDGPARELLADADLMRAHGLEPACAARATAALRRAGVPVEGAPLTAEELARAIARGRGLT